MINISKGAAFLLLSMLLLLAPVTAIQAKTIKIATISPDGTYWMKQMRAGAKEIKEKTDGRVKIKFYPGGVMGNDETVLRKIRVGQLHGGAINVGSLSRNTPETTLYGLPFLFSDLDEAAEIRKSTDPVLSNIIEQNGFVNFGFAQGGFSYVMSKHPVHGFSDLKKQKSWLPEKSDVGMAVYRYIGITPISLPLSDVMTGLQTGLINSVTMSPVGALALQWHTHIKYIVDLPLNYIMAMMIIDKKTFEKLSDADQKTVREVMGDVYVAIDKQNRKDNIAAKNALKKQGIQFIKLSDPEKANWLQAGDAVTAEMVETFSYNKALYKAVTINK